VEGGILNKVAGIGLPWSPRLWAVAHLPMLMKSEIVIRSKFARQKEFGAMCQFAMHHLYTRPEIAAALGGGHQDYLPHHDGRVVCACVSQDLNPDAPAVILPAMGPDIVKWGNRFAEQREFVPVFLKRETNAWQYVGNYRVTEHCTDTDQIERWGVVAQRAGDISMVLFLEQAVGQTARRW
jgi:hypothetical protein